MKFTVGLSFLFLCFTISLSSEKEGTSCPLLEPRLDRSVHVYYFGNEGKRTMETLAFLHCDYNADIFPDDFDLDTNGFYFICSEPPKWEPDIVEVPKCLKKCNLSLVEGSRYKQESTNVSAPSTIKSGENVTMSCQKGLVLFEENNGSIIESNFESVQLGCYDGSLQKSYVCLPDTPTHTIGIELYAKDGTLPDEVHLTLGQGARTMLCGTFEAGILNLHYFNTVPFANTNNSINATIEIKSAIKNKGTWILEKLVVRVKVNGTVYINEQNSTFVQPTSTPDTFVNTLLLALEMDHQYHVRQDSSDPVESYMFAFNNYLKQFDAWERCSNTYLYNTGLQNYTYEERILVQQTCWVSYTEWQLGGQQQTRVLKLCRSKESTKKGAYCYSELSVSYQQNVEKLSKNTTYVIKFELSQNVDDTDSANIRLYFFLRNEFESSEKLYFEGGDIERTRTQTGTFSNQKLFTNIENITIGLERECKGVNTLYFKYVAVSFNVGEYEKVFISYNNTPIIVQPLNNITLEMKEGGCIYPKNAPKVAQNLQKKIYLPGESLSIQDFECGPKTVLSSRDSMECLVDGTWSIIITCVSDMDSFVHIWKQQYQDWCESFERWKSCASELHCP